MLVNDIPFEGRYAILTMFCLIAFNVYLSIIYISKLFSTENNRTENLSDLQKYSIIPIKLM